MAVEKVNFNFIRYANCWEDADVLISGLSPHKGSLILSIGSAGDNSFALLTSEPQSICVFDINPAQLYLIELKKAAIQLLNYDELLYFIGYSNEGEHTRKHLYEKIKGNISSKAIEYWDEHFKIITNGILFSGKFEKYLIFFKSRVLPFIHTQKSVRRLLKPKSTQEQLEYYETYWNTWRWKLMFRIFFSQYVMGRWGRDPEFFQEVKISVSQYIYLKAQKHLQNSSVSANEFLHFALTGHFKPQLPYYLRKENYGLIKQNIHKMEIRLTTIGQLAKEGNQFDYMNLSNIFEYMDKKTFEEIARDIDSIASDQCRLVYWNLMVPRRISAILRDKYKYLDTVSKQLCEQDKGFFYNQIIVDQKI